MKTKNDSSFSVNVKIDFQITRDRIDTLMVSAFEGGSNYWIEKAFAVNPSEDFWDEAAYNSGIWVVRSEDQTHSCLTPSMIQRGFQVMSEKYSRHMGDFLSNNDDATTADVWLQCCLFGDVVYG